MGGSPIPEYARTELLMIGHSEDNVFMWSAYVGSNMVAHCNINVLNSEPQPSTHIGSAYGNGGFPS